MSELDIIRAWKDAQYRQSLSADEQASLPAHPAGSVELSDTELASIDGGASTAATNCTTTAATNCTTTAAATNCTASTICHITADIAPRTMAIP